ncbi:3,4-dihydroxyphenylacetate 2,3-dioxygenase [Andreesenia angusta]|uniref:3,4-dihydroxyphenylacetate 2,3-dioxygenase n=1 Tax=Andreesenia angusta TaxID=39480 RepID=A0A1S1V6E0_9FIRM|nr:AmmeMemoRadiSam system protein A [Andreesenia angusta]OHW62112.1 3,4-dihydroxyphenylacetate 2,3-dioxygenase [Andreesenia angusta]
MGKIIGRYVVPHPPIVVHEIGRGQEEKAVKTVEALERVSEEIARLRPSTVVVVTPHGPLFSDAIAINQLEEVEGDFAQFGRPDVKMKLRIDSELTERIVDSSFEKGIPLVSINEKIIKGYDISGKLDHGTMVPLYYVNERYSSYKLVHITYGMLSRKELYSFGEAIVEAVSSGDSDVVMIASGDLSHRLSEDGPYSYSPAGEEFDSTLLSALERGDSESVMELDEELVRDAGECGLRSLCILLGTLKNMDYTGDVFSYEGPFGVGYAVVKLDTLNSCYTRLARESLKHYIRHGREMDIPDYIPDKMRSVKRGVFVSFKKHGELRGCIGTIYPTTENVAEEIIRNAVEAGQRDPRFQPIAESEIDELEVSVDELLEPELASRDELDPRKYGVIVTSGMRRGLLLPDLEGVDTVEYQLSVALQKAGIYRGEDYSIERFEVIRHGQDE